MRDRLFNNYGFTLIELLVVISLLSVLSVFIAPKISSYLRTESGNFILLTTVISRTFDDSFIHGKGNFLAIHLDQPSVDEIDKNEDFYRRQNGISVVNVDFDGLITDSKNVLLKPRVFSNNFLIDEVLLSNGEKITNGTVLIPFQPEGYSDNAIIHIRTGNEGTFSVVISKFSKEPKILPEYIDFASLWSNEK